jgi:hypothetical protein
MTKYAPCLAYIDAVLIFIIFQSLNVIECPQLRAIFLMLREELQDSDIPSRTTIRKRVDEVLEQHLAQLKRDMAVSPGFICNASLY